ncbi:hypothetical protein TRFO_34727 [Tritrichomonas foetus]|uniref:Myb-like domain-containing protein n=1 Tax=Tritrichomonas foetus TaxID=1144522 RepID=A0A1J4JIB3_9EUKA|nr:hypothetical protein TRFO_34727 [Tritrichomonas foetus]|eukprot:OHS98928.1 hypothetical protein TRFO_34727 [Tritrichomonas foetus]
MKSSKDGGKVNPNVKVKEEKKVKIKKVHQVKTECKKKSKKYSKKYSKQYPDHDEDDTVPENLRTFISQSVWNQYSQIRRDSFKLLLKNPNSFFYRNRPPGDPQKYGSFTEEEEAQFIERIKYFRDVLKIDDGLWGLFAVPLRGRLGYQCSNFYRYLVTEGRVKDPHYKVTHDGKLIFDRSTPRRAVSDESYNKLEREAFEFIKECLDKENCEPITIPPIGSGRGRRNGSKHKHKDKQKILKYSDVYDDPVHPFFNILNIDEIDEEDEKRFTRNNFEYFCDEVTPAHYAMDPISQKPIEDPYIDTFAGVVLDRESWEKFFSGETEYDFDVHAQSFDDLVPLTMRIFNEYSNTIVNIYC